jgi:hypothetical protein
MYLCGAGIGRRDFRVILPVEVASVLFSLLEVLKLATDVLVLGSLAFDDWSTPSKMGYGGRQMTAVHKLPGGARVVDTLGPDEKDIQWTGTF